jgi:hypothetical protein
MMVKVLIYSSKDIFDATSYEGRAESDIVAYRKDDGCYQIIKNRTGRYLGSYTTFHGLQLELKWIECDELDKELKNYKLAQRYVDHPNIELSKNAEVAQG